MFKTLFHDEHSFGVNCIIRNDRADGKSRPWEITLQTYLGGADEERADIVADIVSACER